MLPMLLDKADISATERKGKKNIANFLKFHIC